MSSLLRVVWFGLFVVTLQGSPGTFTPSGPMIPIWPGVAPGSEGQVSPEKWIEGGTPDAFHRVTAIHSPSLTLYLPAADKASGTAVIIAPGGGHRYLVVDLEGEFVARKLNDLGIAVFVLRSRLSRAEGSTYRTDVESLADLQQSIRVIRARAGEWHVNPARVGVMGFSAGGELAALGIARFDATTRPDFAVLGYPAVNGATPIVANAPPVFMFINDDDPLATGAGEYQVALRRARISVESHLFRRGGHGIGATGRNTPDFDQLGVARWPDLLATWLRDLQLLPRAEK